MKFRNAGLLFLASVLIFSVGCAGKGKPKTSPDNPKVSPVAYLLVPGCDGNQKIKDVPGPLKVYREKMFLRYGRFMDSDGYRGEKKIFERCDSIEAIDRYFAQFWGPIRDPDKATPVNEYKALIDERISEIENEIFFDDADIAGTFFSANGGLKGDMAWVYLLRGAPHYKLKIHNMFRVADLMAWIYFDQNQKPLFVFIFSDKGGGYKVFRSHMVMATWESYKQVLQQIAKIYPVSDEDYLAMDHELQMNDTEYIFRFGLRQFSYYDEINIDKVLAPPMPESITAKAIQPKILGVPNIPKDLKFVFSRYQAAIPGFFSLDKVPDGNYRSKLTLGFSSVDWENKNNVYEAKFDALIIFTEQQTREKTEVAFGMNISSTPTHYDNSKDKYFPIELDNLPKLSGDPRNMSISDIIKTLKPGNYEVKLKLLDLRTLKSGVWFQYITINK